MATHNTACTGLAGTVCKNGQVINPPASNANRWALREGEKTADLQCQYPIVKGVAPRCANKARWHDYYGWSFCDEHKTDGDRLLSSERPIKDAPDLGESSASDSESKPATNR